LNEPHFRIRHCEPQAKQSRTSKGAMPAGDCFVGLAASSQ
jgi:hypothetical protein